MLHYINSYNMEVKNIGNYMNIYYLKLQLNTAIQKKKKLLCQNNQN